MRSIPFTKPEMAACRTARCHRDQDEATAKRYRQTPDPANGASPWSDISARASGRTRVISPFFQRCVELLRGRPHSPSSHGVFGKFWQCAVQPNQERLATHPQVGEEWAGPASRSKWNNTCHANSTESPTIGLFTPTIAFQAEGDWGGGPLPPPPPRHPENLLVVLYLRMDSRSFDLQLSEGPVDESGPREVRTIVLDGFLEQWQEGCHALIFHSQRINALPTIQKRPKLHETHRKPPQNRPCSDEKGPRKWRDP